MFVGTDITPELPRGILTKAVPGIEIRKLALIMSGFRCPLLSESIHLVELTVLDKFARLTISWYRYWYDWGRGDCRNQWFVFFNWFHSFSREHRLRIKLCSDGNAFFHLSCISLLAKKKSQGPLPALVGNNMGVGMLVSYYLVPGR